MVATIPSIFNRLLFGMNCVRLTGTPPQTMASPRLICLVCPGLSRSPLMVEPFLL